MKYINKSKDLNMYNYSTAKRVLKLHVTLLSSNRIYKKNNKFLNVIHRITTRAQY